VSCDNLRPQADRRCDHGTFRGRSSGTRAGWVVAALFGFLKFPLTGPIIVGTEELAALRAWPTCEPFENFSGGSGFYWPVREGKERKQS
jgi:hypothetical protein